MGESLESLLEELVYGTDGKRTVVVKNVAHNTSGLPLQFLNRRKHGRHKIIQIIRLVRLCGHNEEFLEYSALHLVCGLVGKGHSQYMPVGITLLAFKEQSYIFLCQRVGLS